MKHSFSHFTILAIVILLFTSCATKSPEKKAEKITPIKSISILPVEVVVDRSKQLSKGDAEQLEKGKDVLNRLIAEYFAGFEGMESITFVSESKIEAMDIDFSRCPTYLSQVKMICQNIGSDAALAFSLHRYIEREGTTYSAIQPASVHFEYKLFDTKTGRVLTASRFDETQQALFENLFKFSQASKRGFKWIKVEDFTREGLHQKLQNDSYLKKE